MIFSSDRPKIPGGSTYWRPFAREGLPGVRGGKANEVGIRGLGRQKDWDLAYVLAGKPRLLISLKSILKNLSGVVPNRLDDLMGRPQTCSNYRPKS